MAMITESNNMFNGIPILTSDSYRGLSVNLAASSIDTSGAQPVFVGRLVWPGTNRTDDYLIKLYPPTTCGIANEVIGYAANALRSIAQPKKAAILLLPPNAVSGLGFDAADFIDEKSGLIACWLTSFEQGAKPFKYIRRMPSFSKKQATAFLRSKFCIALTTVDYVTGNSDRHDGNYLYIDDLNYLAIDQGCVGGGVYWHKNYPDKFAINELVKTAQATLNSSEMAAWTSQALLEHGKTQSEWKHILPTMGLALQGILDAEAIKTIVQYMGDRATGEAFATACGHLI